MYVYVALIWKYAQSKGNFVKDNADWKIFPVEYQIDNIDLPQIKDFST